MRLDKRHWFLEMQKERRKAEVPLKKKQHEKMYGVLTDRSINIINSDSVDTDLLYPRVMNSQKIPSSLSAISHTSFSISNISIHSSLWQIHIGHRSTHTNFNKLGLENQWCEIVVMKDNLEIYILLCSSLNDFSLSRLYTYTVYVCGAAEEWIFEFWSWTSDRDRSPIWIPCVNLGGILRMRVWFGLT